MTNEKSTSSQSYQTPSQPPPPYSQGQSSSSSTPASNIILASLSLHMNDRIRLLNFPLTTQQLVRDAILQTWPRGIQDERLYSGSQEFKLNGNPWSGIGSSDAINSRRMMCRILNVLKSSGWTLKINTTITRKQEDKDTLLFQYSETKAATEKALQEPNEWMAVAFSKSDRLRLIDSPAVVSTTIVNLLKPMIQSHGPFTEASKVYECKFHGYPWVPMGSATMDSRRIALGIMQGLEMCGFSVYAAIDMKTAVGGDAAHGQTDTWFCRRTGAFS